VFLVPFLWFLWRGWVEPPLRARLWTIFALGAALGAIGWWMVASGLSERVSVSQYRLAFHLTLACLIFAAIVWTAQGLAPRAPIVVPTRIRAGALAVLVLVVIQIYLGARVAGLRAGLIYNTWPLIDGSLVPDASRLFFNAPLWRNFFENTLTVQFDHRMVAYALEAAVLLHAFDVARTLRGGPALTAALALASVITIQAALGIATLLHQAPLALALLHQAMAMVVLAIALVHAQRLVRQPARAGAMAGEPPLRHGEQTT
jgi:cytochrome c oxidase assembly protein subunit 15